MVLHAAVRSLDEQMHKRGSRWLSPMLHLRLQMLTKPSEKPCPFELGVLHPPLLVLQVGSATATCLCTTIVLSAILRARLAPPSRFGATA